MEVIKDLMEFFKSRRKYWLLPTVLFILLAGILGIGIGSLSIAPLIYALF
jgi:hypothetical protein